MRCPNCGHENRDEDRFCMACGKSLGDDPSGSSRGYVPASPGVPYSPPQPSRLWMGIKAILAVLLFVSVMFVSQSCVISGFITSSMVRSGAANAAASGMNFLTQEMLNELLESVYENMVLILLIANLATILAICLLFRLRRRKPAEEFALYFVNPLRLAEFALLGTSLNILVSVALSLIPLPESVVESFENQYASLYGQNLFVEILSVAVAAPIVEEILFRGIAMTRLGPVFGGAASVILSAVLFGLAHGTPIAVGYAFAMGILLSLVYLRYRSILPCIVCHCFFNLTSYWLPEENETAVLILCAASLLLFVVLGISSMIVYPRFDDVVCDISGRIRVKDPEMQTVIDDCRRLRTASEASYEEVDALRERWNAAKEKKRRK